MDSSTSPSCCERCGKTVTGYSARDRVGNLYCHACMERLCGNGAHDGAAHTCALCGVIFQNGSEATPRFGGKGLYCSDCLSRLHGQRPMRRASGLGTRGSRDAAFDQMIQEIFESPVAMAG